METKQNSKFYIVFGLILFASFGFIAIATMDYQSYYEVSYPNNNLALPEINGKTEISPNVYRLYESDGITLDYNIINGIYNVKAISNIVNYIYRFPLVINGNHTISYYYVSGTLSSGNLEFSRKSNSSALPLNSMNYMNNQNVTVDYTNPLDNQLDITLFNGPQDIDLTFKLQISKGSYLLPYVVPKETIIYAHNQDYSALTEIGSVAITSLTGFINGFKVVGDILQTLVQFQQTVVYEVSKFLIENYLKVIDFIEAITDNGLIEWIKDPMKGFRF